MIKKYKFSGKIFNFVKTGAVQPDSNIFTLIVGKNGTGKSRLLSAVVSEFIKISSSESILGDDNAKPRTKSVIYDNIPKKAITVSTSPFDKFPIPKRGVKITGYSYLGLRDLSSQNLGLAYMSKIVTSLLETILVNPSQMDDTSNILNYLGYEDKIKIRFQIQSTLYSLVYGNKSKSSKITASTILNDHSIVSLSNRRYFTDENRIINNEKAQMLVSAIKKINPNYSIGGFYIDLDRSGIVDTTSRAFSIQECLMLFYAGFIKLREVYLERTDSKKVYSITDASSGEQSVVISFLGIASQIENNTLICIDEPEICLHPEWQEKYIKLLIDTFSRYENCHFIIATHSPQIISKLDSHNCFVLSMDDRVVKDAKDLINNSIDFQLANVFKSPGFKNEYLSRIALNVFSNVSRSRKFNETDLKDYAILAAQEKLLQFNDPVRDLLFAIKEMHKAYAGNK
jgi:predicted ATPase